MDTLNRTNEPLRNEIVGLRNELLGKNAAIK
jgi:hypothetical protein